MLDSLCIYERGNICGENELGFTASKSTVSHLSAPHKPCGTSVPFTCQSCFLVQLPPPFLECLIASFFLLIGRDTLKIAIPPGSPSHITDSTHCFLPEQADFQPGHTAFCVYWAATKLGLDLQSERLLLLLFS